MKRKEVTFWHYVAIIAVLLLITFAMAFAAYALVKAGKAMFGTPSENNNMTTKVYFCPEERCMERLISQIASAEKQVDCAFYDLDLAQVINVLEASGAEIRLVIDDESYDANWKTLEWLSDRLRKDIKGHQMHNKFCVIDNRTVVTGSMNPTFNDNYKNNNNIVVINSEYISQNYLKEFEELWGGAYGKGNPVKRVKVLLNDNLIENYFCPEDCGPEIYTSLIEDAEESVRFMAFSFTQDDIGDALVEAHKKGIRVAGIFDYSQYSSQKKYSEYDRMLGEGIPVVLENSTGKLHHKVFIIDNSTVITGSANPSNNGLEENDENILILHDRQVAARFSAEFEKLMEIYG